MRTQVKLCEVTQKTVEEVIAGKGDWGNNARCVIAFTDGTFAAIGIDRGWEGGDEEMEDDDFDWHDYPKDRMLAMGFVTQDILDREELERQDREREKKHDREDRERAKLAELKKKYE